MVNIVEERLNVRFAVGIHSVKSPLGKKSCISKVLANFGLVVAAVNNILKESLANHGSVDARRWACKTWRKKERSDRAEEAKLCK